MKSLTTIKLWVYVAILVLSFIAIWILSLKLPSSMDDMQSAQEVNVPAASVDLAQQLDDINLFESKVANLDQSEPLKPVIKSEQNLADAETFRRMNGKWVIEVMDVADPKIIKDYLYLHQFNTNLKYYRYQADENQLRLKLVWGIYDSQAAAASDSRIDPSLGIRMPYQLISVERILATIDDYYVMSRVRDYSQNRVRSVSLTPIEYVEPVMPDFSETYVAPRAADNSIDEYQQLKNGTDLASSIQSDQQQPSDAPKEDELFDLIQDIKD